MDRTKTGYPVTVFDAKAVISERRRVKWEQPLVIDVWQYRDDRDARVHSDALKAPESENLEDYAEDTPCDVALMQRAEYADTVLANSCVEIEDIFPDRKKDNPSSPELEIAVVILNAHAQPKAKK